jgi:hypothetical protein
MTRETSFVEPVPIVVGDPRRQNLSLPRRGRHFKALQLGQDCIERS